MASLFSDYENLRATYYDNERDKDALDECMAEVGDAYKALKDMTSGNAGENAGNAGENAMEEESNMGGGARRKHRKTRHRKTKKHSHRRRRQTRRHH